MEIQGTPDLGLNFSIPGPSLNLAAARRALDKSEALIGKLDTKTKKDLQSRLLDVAGHGAAIEMRTVQPLSNSLGTIETNLGAVRDLVHNDLKARLLVSQDNVPEAPPPIQTTSQCQDYSNVHPIGSDFLGYEVCGWDIHLGLIVRDRTTHRVAYVYETLTGTVSDPLTAVACGAKQNPVVPDIWYLNIVPGATPPSWFHETDPRDTCAVNGMRQEALCVSQGHTISECIQFATTNSCSDPVQCFADCGGGPPTPCPSWHAYSTTQTSNDCECVCSTDPPPAGKTYLRGTFGSESECQSFALSCQNNPPPTGCCPSVTCPPTTVTCPQPPVCQYISACDLDSWCEWAKRVAKCWKEGESEQKSPDECDLYNETAWWQEDCASELTDPMQAWYGDVWDSQVDAGDVGTMVANSLSTLFPTALLESPATTVRRLPFH